jgi:histone acetyltransferase
MTLCDAKNLICKQLPNMGASYVTRLVYDINAESVMVVHKGAIVGIISSRLFPEQKFIEIVFCAVNSNLQGGGYGRLVMAFLKTVIQAKGLYDILTCADNDAVGSFKKQGFNEKEIRMEPDRWIGYIKDYDWVTLVHCPISPELDYLNFSEDVLGKQLRWLEQKVGIHVVSKAIPEFDPSLPGLPHGVYNLSVGLPMLLSRYAPHLRSPGVLSLMNAYDAQMSVLKSKLFKILNGLKSDQKNAEIFRRPVTEDIAPDYFESILSPMDLFSIENRLRRYDDYYKRPEIFAIDVKLMCDNAKQFNPADSPFYRNAVELYRRFRRLYNEEFPESDVDD